jgi:predicted enzyme related to lactoylglutathione lyase
MPEPRWQTRAPPSKGLEVVKVTGVGGVFLRAQDQGALATWYAEVLGLPVEQGDYAVLRSSGGETLTWAAFPADTDYFGAKGQAVMVNYRVDDLDAMLERLRQAGTVVDDHIEEHEFGRFGWAVDPEGNRLELWQPPPGH